MNAVSYQDLALAWHPKSNHEKPFTVFLLIIVVMFLGSGLFLSSVNVPKKEHRSKIEVPERIAKFILDKPKPEPVKKKPKIVEKPKPKVRPKPKVKRKKPVKEIKLTEKQRVARKKAEQSGLIALSDELSDLIDTSTIDIMVGKPITKAVVKATQSATVNTNLLTKSSDAVRGSDNVQTATHLPGVSSKTRLLPQQGAVARQLIAARAEEPLGKGEEKTTAASQQPRVGNYRSEEDIAFVIDKNKSKLHAIYRSARRKNPGIKGMIVLEITILPSGKVEAIKIKSSELNNARLETNLIARIKQFDFGAQDVKKVTVTYPVEFLPS